MGKEELDKVVWCNIRLGGDLNWWCTEFNVPVQWDRFDSVSVIDPRQVAYMLEKIEEMRDYGLDESIVEAAFFTFQIESVSPADKTAHLVRVNESILGASEETAKTLFALPRSLDDADPGYENFLNHIARLRVDYINDRLDSADKILQSELEDQVRAEGNQLTIEGRSLHVFREILSILEFKPAGYEFKTNDEGKVILAASSQDDIDSALIESKIVEADFDPNAEEFDENGNLIIRPTKRRRGRRPRAETDTLGGSDTIIK